VISLADPDPLPSIRRNNMPHRTDKDQDDTASIRSSVSSIFPSFSSKRQNKRRPLTNLWVFTNSSRDASNSNSTNPDPRPESSASMYEDTSSVRGERTSARSRRFNGLWHSTNNTPLISPVPTVKEDETTPTSSRFPASPNPVVVEGQGLDSLRRNGKLLRTKMVDSICPMANTPTNAIHSMDAIADDRRPLRSPRLYGPAAGSTSHMPLSSYITPEEFPASPSHPPVTFNPETPRSPRSPLHNPDIGIPHQTSSRSSSTRRKEITGSGSTSPVRKGGIERSTKHPAVSLEQEVGELGDVPSDEEGSMAGECWYHLTV
jgi:hypothetical protein